MSLFKCRLCGKVYSTEFLSLKNNLCKSCFVRLEDMYTNSGIHDYIRDKGLSEDFNPEELAHELKMNPRIIKILSEMGFIDRDIQVYNQASKERRKKLAEEFSNEIKKINNKNEKNELNTPEPDIKIKIRSKFISYGGRIYRRQTR